MKFFLRTMDRMFYQEVFVRVTLNALRFWCKHKFWGGDMSVVNFEKINSLEVMNCANRIMHLRLKGFIDHRMDKVSLPTGIPTSVRGNLLRERIDQIKLSR